MLALDTYAARFDKVDAFVQQNTVTKSMNMMTDKFTERMGTIANTVSNEMSKSISSVADKLDNLENSIGNINDTVDYIQNNMLEYVYVPDELDSALQDIQSTVDGIESRVETLPEPDSYYLSRINSTLNTMSSSINEIKDGMQNDYEDDSDYDSSEDLEAIKNDLQTLLNLVREKFE